MIGFLAVGGQPVANRLLIRKWPGICIYRCMKILLWFILLVLCWPVAIALLFLYPIIWLFLLPFRLVGFAAEGVFRFIGALFLLPARILGR